MTGVIELTLIFGLLIALMMCGMPIAYAVGVASMLYIASTLGPAGLNSLGVVAWATADSFTLTTLPLFLLMSELLVRGGLGDRMYRGLSRLVYRLPGGLLQTNLAGCTVFAAISGSSIATAAAIGTVALPQLKQRGYDMRIGAATLAAGGTLGILIPPSLGFIIYGSFTDTSIARLFMAGVVPGLAVALAFMLYVACHAKVRPAIAPPEPARPWTRTEIAQTFFDLVPVALLLLGILSGIYLGVFTPTEAAAVGTVLALALACWRGDMSFDRLRAALRSTVNATAGIMLIVLAASMFSFATGMAGVPQALSKVISGLGLSSLEFVVLVAVIYLVLGCVMESIGIMVITIPILWPLVRELGIDPIWFGVYVVLLIEIGMITPPFGINLFVIQSIRRDGTLSEVIRGVTPFVLIMIGFVGLLIALPGLATWLPGRM